MAVYEIAGLRVRMDTFGRTLTQARPYLTREPGPVDVVIETDPKALLERIPAYETLEVAEYMGTGGAFSRQILKYDALQLHSSAVMLGGKAYLFTAPSGRGKSTHTEKWCRLFGARLLNDDKPVLRCFDGTWMACGTPWSGKHDLSLPARAPVGGIAYLQRGEENAIERMEPGDALPYIMSQCVRVLDMEQMDLQLSHLDRLLRQVPVWLLTARNDDGAAFTARQAMEGNSWKR